jgi:hypothetical protein
MTVGTEPYPATLGTALFEVTGVIYGDTSNGLVDFAIEGGNELHVGFYYFEVEMVDAFGGVDTILFGWYEVKQDKTKTDVEFVWNPSGTVDDPVPWDGSEMWDAFAYESADMLEYKTRDARTVARTNFDIDPYTFERYLHPLGAESPRKVFDATIGFEFWLVAYLDTATLKWQVGDLRGNDIASHGLDLRTGAAQVKFFKQSQNNVGTDVSSGVPNTDVTGWVAGWYQFDLRIQSAANLFYRMYPEGSPTAWLDCAYAFEAKPYQPVFGIAPAAGGLVDIYEWGWRRI